MTTLNQSRFSPKKPDENLVMTSYYPYNRSKNGTYEVYLSL